MSINTIDNQVYLLLGIHGVCPRNIADKTDHFHLRGLCLSYYWQYCKLFYRQLQMVQNAENKYKSATVGDESHHPLWHLSVPLSLGFLRAKVHLCGGAWSDRESCVRQIHRLTGTQNKMQRRLAVRRASRRVEELTIPSVIASRIVGR